MLAVNPIYGGEDFYTNKCLENEDTDYVVMHPEFKQTETDNIKTVTNPAFDEREFFTDKSTENENDEYYSGNLQSSENTD